MVGEVCENDEKAGIYQKLDTVRITTSVMQIIVTWGLGGVVWEDKTLRTRNSDSDETFFQKRKRD